MPESTKVGKRTFMPVFLPATPEEKAKGLKAQLVAFSEQETLVLRSFLRTRDLQTTADELELKKDSVRRILGRPNLRRFLDDLKSRAAIAESTDLNMVLRELRLTYEGEVKPTPEQMDALKTLSKMLTPKGPVVAIQNNTNVYSNPSNDDWRDAREAAEGA